MRRLSGQVGQSDEVSNSMKFPCQGHFWLPGSPEKSVFGTLTFTRRDGAVLALGDELSADSPSEVDIIVGQTANGTYVTLLHANQTSAPLIRLTKTYPCSYHATCLVVGAAFDSEAYMRFSLWQIRLPQLNAWVGRHGFAVDTPEFKIVNDGAAVQIGYQTPEKQLLLATDGLHLALSFWPLLRSAPYARALRQDVSIEVRLGPDQDALEDYMKTATRFEHFLTLATGALVRTGSIKAVVRADHADETGSPIIVEILYQPVRNVLGTESRKHEFLFTLTDIAGIDQDCFRNWFTKADWLDPICALYFGTLYNPSKYLDFNFLALVQAVEAYHRRASGETDEPAAEHESRVRAILDAAPAAHRAWLVQKLAHSNELSLRRRLKLLFAQFAAIFDCLLSDRKAMINTIYENRNYLTHYDPASAVRPASGSRLLLMVEILKLLLQACLVSQLELPQTMLNTFVSRSRTVRMIRHLNDRSTAAGA
jgi:hypothetical protein